MNILSYLLSSKKAKSAVSGISSYSVEGTTLKIKCNDGNVLKMTFPTPKDGVSVTDIDINENHELTFIMSDGSRIAAGQIDTIKGDKGDQGEKGEQGDTGVSPLVTENDANTEDIYKLDITDIAGTFTTPNLKGKQGIQGIQGVRGEKGDRGETGLTGEPGADGVSPIFMENDANTDDVYKLDIVDIIGTHTTPNLIGRQGPQGLRGETGPQGEQGIQGIQGIQGEKGEDGYPFLIYREYSSLDEFNPDHFPEIGLMFMIKAEEGQNSYPIYRYTGMDDVQYSFVTDLATSEGLKGEKGDKGDKGDQGIQGERGIDGTTYTPAIGTVTTADSASDATADIVIDSDAKTATFNFSIPRGQNGLPGIQGEQGPQGIPGESGKDGVDGTTYIPTIGTVTTVSSNEEASASVSTTMDESKLAIFDFNIPKGVGVEKIEFTSSSLGDVAGLPGATDTYTITYTDRSISTYEVYNGQDCGLKIDDETTSETSVWSSKKTSDELGKKQDNLSVRKVYARRNSSANKYILLATIDMSKITYIGQPLRIKGVIGNMASDITNIDLVINARNGFVKKILSGTVTHKNFLTNDANIIITKSDDEKTAYVYLYCISTYGYIDAEIYLGSVHYLVPSTFDLVETMQGTEYTNLLDTNYVVIENVINDTTSSTTSTYSSAKINEINANRQVKTFDNSGSSTEKWYKLCSAITGGIGCNIKLTASRADSTATVQYFSALFRDNRYRYTSTSLTRERTVYESELVAEYSAYIVADANNDIWVHAPSYGKVIIEIDARAITIDGTVGTPVKDYVYSSYESQSTKERLDRMNIKQFNQPGSNTSFKYVTITSTGSGLGGLELNVPYAGKYMFSTPKSEPVYFGSSTHKGYTLNGWAWSDDGKTLYLRVAGFAPFSISVLGSVPKDINANNVVTISDMTYDAPEGATFVSSPVHSNATTNDIGVKKVFYATKESYPSIFWVLSDATTGVFWFKHTLSSSAGVQSVEGYADLTHNVVRLINESDISVYVGTDEISGKKGVRFTVAWGDNMTTSCKITEARPVTAIPTQIVTR